MAYVSECWGGLTGGGCFEMRFSFGWWQCRETEDGLSLSVKWNGNSECIMSKIRVKSNKKYKRWNKLVVTRLR